MTNATARLTDAQADALARRLAARPVPRDASSMARASVVDITTRRPPLGLAPILDDEPEDRDEPAPEMTEARSAELIAYRVARGENRGAVIADIDILVERAILRERHAIDKGFDNTSRAVGECIGEVAGDIEARLGAKIEALVKTVDALRLQLARMEGAASVRSAPRTVAPRAKPAARAAKG